MEQDQGAAGRRPYRLVRPDCRCSTCTAYREATSRQPGRGGADDPLRGRPRSRRPQVADGFDTWRRRRLPARVAGLVTGVVVVLAAPELTRLLAEQLGQPPSGLFTDVARGAIPALVALPLLRAIAYRRRDALLIFFIPLVGIWLLARIGWRLPVVRHPDWSPRPEIVDLRAS